MLERGVWRKEPGTSATEHWRVTKAPLQGYALRTCRCTTEFKIDTRVSLFGFVSFYTWALFLKLPSHRNSISSSTALL